MSDSKQVQQRNPSVVRNPSLYYEKILTVDYCRKLEQDTRKAQPEDLQQSLLHEKLSKLSLDNQEISESLKDRRRRLLKSFHGVFDQTLVVSHYLLVGSGRPSVFDVGFTFMRNYGVPYIPSSAFKGAFSHYVKSELSDDNLLKREFRNVFGEDASAEDDHVRGSIVFLDVIPERYRLGIDIINNHFQSYYMDDKGAYAPNDYYNPIPVQYLVVERGSAFRFSVISKNPLEKELKHVINRELITFLCSYGIGAKTAYGYGLFREQ